MKSFILFFFLSVAGITHLRAIDNAPPIPVEIEAGSSQESKQLAFSLSEKIRASTHFQLATKNEKRFYILLGVSNPHNNATNESLGINVVSIIYTYTNGLDETKIFLEDQLNSIGANRLSEMVDSILTKLDEIDKAVGLSTSLSKAK